MGLSPHQYIGKTLDVVTSHFELMGEMLEHCIRERESIMMRERELVYKDRDMNVANADNFRDIYLRYISTE